MSARTLRAAIVGATTLLGRELAEQLNEATAAVWDLKLLDTEEASGQMSAAGDEALVIQSLAPGVFERMDIVFFASHPATVRTHWKEAQASGAGIIDLTGTLAKEPGAVMLAPGVGTAAVEFATSLVLPAHPAALMLASVARKLKDRFGASHLAATVLHPASEWGKAGLDEMHQQTVGLLTFQAVPKDVYDTQVAFNLTTELGEEAQESLMSRTEWIERDFASLATSCELTLMLVQAPVFNGYAASIFVTLPEASSREQLNAALSGGWLQVVPADEPSPTNVSATGQRQILVRVESASTIGRSWALWLAADNLLLAAENAIACAMELARLRPGATLQ